MYTLYLIILLTCIGTPASGAEDADLERDATALVTALSPIDYDVNTIDDTITFNDGTLKREWHITDVSKLIKYAQNQSTNLCQWISNWIWGKDLEEYPLPVSTRETIKTGRNYLIGALVSHDIIFAQVQTEKLLYLDWALGPAGSIEDDDLDYVP